MLFDTFITYISSDHFASCHCHSVSLFNVELLYLGEVCSTNNLSLNFYIAFVDFAELSLDSTLMFHQFFAFLVRLVYRKATHLGGLGVIRPTG